MIPLFVIVLSLGWVSLLVAAPQLPVALAGFLYLFGSVICHQLSERSFHVDGAQLPVCARCIGVYGGFVVGVCVATLSRLVPGSDPATEHHRPVTPIAVLVVGAAPTVLTVALEWIDLWHPSNAVRAAAGGALGVGIAVVVAGAVATLHYVRCVLRQPIVSNPPTHI